MQGENLVIHKLFDETAKKFPDKIASEIKKDNHWLTFTYRQLQLRSLEVAAFLIKEGFKKGDFASLILENRPEWPMIYLGIVRAGLTCVPLDPALHQLELKALIADSGAKVVFCSNEVFINKISASGGNLIKVVLLDSQEAAGGNIIRFSDIENISADNALYPEASCDDAASLIYTSGTTASPKGVVLSHKNISSDATNLRKLNLFLSSDNVLSI